MSPTLEMTPITITQHINSTRIGSMSGQLMDHISGHLAGVIMGHMVGVFTDYMSGHINSSITTMEDLNCTQRRHMVERQDVSKPIQGMNRNSKYGGIFSFELKDNFKAKR